MDHSKRSLALIITTIMIATCLVPTCEFSYASGELFEPVAPEVDASYKGRNAKKIPVLTYHRLASDKEKKMRSNRHDKYVISKSNFRKQMKYLHENNWRTLSIEEFYLWHEGKIRLPRRSVLITFDDGSYSAIKYALPILKGYDMRATMFMIGDRTKTKTKKTASRKGRYRSIGLDVMEQVSSTYPNFQFQSHTWGMHKKTEKGIKYARHLSFKAQKKDMERQYKAFGYTFLAYPYGAFTGRTIKAAKAGGIKMAFVYGNSGYADKSQNRYKIKRIKVLAQTPMTGFKRWLR